jgi:uracil-DNA glycosylase family 4
VRCAPPENKPTPAEINTCRIFLSAQITTLTQLRAALTLGKIAHDSLMRALREPLSKRVFRHGAMHKVNGLMVFNSYHCSRYNTNTGTLTQAMFREVFAAVRSHLNGLDRNQSSTASE